MNAPRRVARLVLTGLLVGASALGGCRALMSDAGWIDPTRQWKAPPAEQMPVHPILPTASYADPAEEVIPSATPPTPEDLIVIEKDYIIGPTDVLDIGILDLLQEGLETVLRREVSETGFIRLPLLDEKIKVSGLTREQLREALVDLYRPDVLKDPTIAISIVARRQNTFSILGAIARPGSYNIFRNDTRLLDAMALAGDVTQTNIDWIYVVRQELVPAPPAVPPVAPPTTVPVPTLPAVPPETQPAEPEREREKILQELEKILEGLPPGSEGKPVTPGSVAYLTETSEDLMRPLARPRGSAQSANRLPTWAYDAKRKQMVRVPLTAASVEPSAAEASGELDQTGRAVVPAEPDAAAAEPPTTTRAVAEPQTAPTTEPASQPLPQTAPSEKPQEPKPQVVAKGLDEEDPFGWRKAARLDQMRVIAIDLNKLRNGDPKMNIVIRDRDAIVIPELQRGEFYLGGEFERPGVYSLTGRKVTLKQAIAAGSNFSTLAWPRNGMLVRRIGKNQEQLIALDLEAIMRGEQQDLFLKPDDLVVVGSDPRALPLVIVRNAFRLTYGFGFIYDRNFAEPAPFRMDSMRFKRW